MKAMVYREYGSPDSPGLQEIAVILHSAQSVFFVFLVVEIVLGLA